MIKFKIATPERVLFDAEVRCQVANKREFFAVSGGVIEVRKNHEVVVLADTAEFGHEIDLKRAEEARDRAKLLMLEKAGEPEAFQEAAASFGRNLARIKVAHKHRTHKHPHVES